MENKEFRNYKIAKFKNDFLTSINLNKLNTLTSLEFNYLISLVGRLHDQNKKADLITFEEIKDLLNLKNYSIKKISDYTLKNTNNLLKQWITIKDGINYKEFPMFTLIKLDEEKGIYYEVNEHFLTFFNNFENESFTKFKIKEFNAIKSKYTKYLYFLLKEFRKTGQVYLNYEEFCYSLLGIPRTIKTKDLNKLYIKPMLKELTKLNYFKNLEYKLNRNSKKQIKTIIFTFDIEPKEHLTTFKNQKEKINYLLSDLENTNNQLEKAENKLQQEIATKEKQISNIQNSRDQLEKADTQEEIQAIKDNQIF